MSLVDEHVIKTLSAQHGTPFYYYDGDELKKHYESVIEALDPSITVYLSLKANHNIALAHLFCQWGSGVEVASKGELFLAIQAGFPSDRIIFSGPGKQMAEMKYAMEHNISCIIVESIEELELIQDAARNAGKRINIGVRINPDKSFSSGMITMGGSAKQFGIDESQIPAFMQELERHPDLYLNTVHIYNGTQVLDADQIVNSFEYTIEKAIEIQENYNVNLEVVNLGGGMGVNYFSHEKPLNFGYVASQLNSLIKEAKNNGLGEAKFILESGRYLLAESGMYVTKVLYTKYSKGEKFAIVDGGLHHHMASTFRGRTLRNNFPIQVIQSNRNGLSGITEKMHIVGPLCTPEDCIARNIELNSVGVGDFIVVLKSGAYGLSYSPVFFLGHPAPMEILKFQDHFYVIRERGSEEDLLRNQVMPELRLEVRNNPKKRRSSLC